MEKVSCIIDGKKVTADFKDHARQVRIGSVSPTEQCRYTCGEEPMSVQVTVVIVDKAAGAIVVCRALRESIAKRSGTFNPGT